MHVFRAVADIRTRSSCFIASKNIVTRTATYSSLWLTREDGGRRLLPKSRAETENCISVLWLMRDIGALGAGTSLNFGYLARRKNDNRVAEEYWIRAPDAACSCGCLRLVRFTGGGGCRAAGRPDRRC